MHKITYSLKVNEKGPVGTLRSAPSCEKICYTVSKQHWAQPAEKQATSLPLNTHKDTSLTWWDTHPGAL